MERGFGFICNFYYYADISFYNNTRLAAILIIQTKWGRISRVLVEHLMLGNEFLENIKESSI